MKTPYILIGVICCSILQINSIKAEPVVLALEAIVPSNMIYPQPIQYSNFKPSLISYKFYTQSLCYQLTFVFIEHSSDVECHGRRTFKNVTLTAYYPIDDEGNALEKENFDLRGNPLATLQDFLDDGVDFVTVSMDDELHIPYGTRICIPELNDHFRRHVNLQIRDTGSNVKGHGFRRVDICVRSEPDSYDRAVNLKQATVVF